MTQQGYPQDNRSNGYPDDPRRAADNRSPAPSHEDEPTELLAPGDWPCRAVAERFGEAGNGTIQIGVRIRFTDGPNAGKMSTWYSSFTENGEAVTLKGMRALGHRGDDIFDCRGFYDKEIQSVCAPIAVVEHETFQGKTRAKVKFINGADVIMANDMSEADRNRFRQRMKGVLGRSGGSSSSGGGDKSGGRGTEDRGGWNAPPQQGGRQQQPQQTRGGRDDREVPPPDEAPPWDGNGRGGRGGNRGGDRW